MVVHVQKGISSRETKNEEKIVSFRLARQSTARPPVERYQKARIKTRCRRRKAAAETVMNICNCLSVDVIMTFQVGDLNKLLRRPTPASCVIIDGAVSIT